MRLADLERNIATKLVKNGIVLFNDNLSMDECELFNVKYIIIIWTVLDLRGLE